MSHKSSNGRQRVAMQRVSFAKDSSLNDVCTKVASPPEGNELRREHELLQNFMKTQQVGDSVYVSPRGDYGKAFTGTIISVDRPRCQILVEHSVTGFRSTVYPSQIWG